LRRSLWTRQRSTLSAISGPGLLFDMAGFPLALVAGPAVAAILRPASAPFAFYRTSGLGQNA